jgi:hypothetical protein
MTLTIPLSQGKQTIIDDEDWPLISQYTWHVHGKKWTSKDGTVVVRWYAGSNIPQPDGRKGYRELHNFLMHTLYEAPEPGATVDHINGNSLDNRRSNLRWATSSQNSANVTIRSHNTSGFKGIVKSGQKWRAKLNYKGRYIHLGYFSTPEEAAKAYDKKAFEIYGEFVQLNFPRP